MGAPECPGCRTRDVRIAALENEVRQLRDELRQLKARRGRPACGHVTWRAIPADRCQHSIGPGLAAATAYLAGCHQVSKRGLEEIVETLFEVPVALGTVSNLEQEMSQALAAAHAEAVRA